MPTHRFYLTLESPRGIEVYRALCELLPEHGTPREYAQRLATTCEQVMAKRGLHITPGCVTWECFPTRYNYEAFASGPNLEELAALQNASAIQAAEAGGM